MGESAETVKLLRGIWNEMKVLNGRINETNARLDQTNAKLDHGFAEVNARLDQTNARLDHVVEFIGERYRDQNRALRSLDKRVTRLESRSAR